MSKVSGFILKLDNDRYNTFLWNIHEMFAQPVSEFTFSRNIPLVCFISDSLANITHIGLATRGHRAGTDLRRLNIYDIFQLNKSVSAVEIANETNKKIRHHLNKYVENGGLIPNKSFQEFLEIFLTKAPETVPILNKYSISRELRIKKLSKAEEKSLAEQKEAVLTALNIAGIDKKDALGWDYSEEEKPTSFLAGLPKAILREDNVISNDLVNMLDFDYIKTTIYSTSIFKKDNTYLKVILANRFPLEELIGTDLIYFNEDFKCFIMVQYKMMEKENATSCFRIPNKQFSKEIERMDFILNALKKETVNGLANDYRINENPFFIKICPKVNFDPDNVGLSKGMYIPLDYIKVLEEDECIKGKNGGKSISFSNIGRYFDNTAFKIIVENGWIGTNHNQSKLLDLMIKEVIENGRTAVIAIKKSFK